MSAGFPSSQGDQVDRLSSAVLSVIHQMDTHLGTATWNLYMVAIVTALSILLIKSQLKQRHGIDWYALVHACVTGIGSVLCFYLDWQVASSEKFPGQCGDVPPTSLHRILPAITMGYSIFDMLDGWHLRMDFLVHGGATFTVMLLFVGNDVPHLVNSMLLMENSSIFLNLVRYHHFSPFWSLVNQLCFIASFFFFRILLVPYIWMTQVSLLLKQEQTDDYCLPWYFSKVVVLLGLVFHILNAYWFYKILRKAMRKLRGSEKLNERNDLTETEHDLTESEDENGDLNGKKKKS